MLAGFEWDNCDEANDDSDIDLWWSGFLPSWGLFC